VSRRNHTRHPTEGGKLYAFFISFVASIGGFLFGYDLVIISGAQIFIRDQFGLTPSQFGFATSSALLGCIAGPSLGAWLCDQIGRKGTLLVAGGLFVIGAAGTALADNIVTFNVFRIAGGVGVGLSSLASPMYIAEIAPRRNRGRLGIMYQLAITIGAVAATLVAYCLAKTVADTVSWRWMFASVIVPVIIFAVLLLRVPQSPRWLAQKGRFEEAREILTRVDGPENGEKELAEIRGSLSEETGGLAELFQPGIRTALLTGIALALFNNWTGWTGIAFYLPTLFQKAGYAQASDAIGQNVLVMGGNVLLTLVSIWLVDRAGRRALWIAGSAAMFVCLILAGMVFQYNVTGPIVVLVIFLCAAPHAVALGPLPWLMMSEIYPTRIRAKAVSISTTFLWIAGFSGPLAFPLLEAVSEKLFKTIAGVFWLYAGVCVISFFWALKYLPETKGRSLEEIARSWMGSAPGKGLAKPV
jgi:sugar porter (SP) family MFS transporter